MDTLRGFDRDSTGAEFDLGGYEDDVASEPPPVVGQDERRMQVRAYNYWASQLGTGSFPRVTPLLEGHNPDFADNIVLLHFDAGIEDPAIVWLGQKLADECGTETSIHRLSQIPGRSLLSRITDHYMQIIANQAPIGFEAEFVNQYGRTVLYRGILLPYSSDGTAIDYIMGAINWKELADQQTTDELLLEIGQALDTAPIKSQPRRPLAEATDAWADGPAALDLGDFPEPAFGLDDDILPLPAKADEPAPEALADWLASARELALVANSSEDRTRSALYAAIGRAWDFALAAQGRPEDFAELLEDAGLTMQERAPMTPVVKLVFGADYDKTRLTEYATALTHAQRVGLGQGELGRYLSEAPGGLKGVVNAERRLRREEAGKALAKRGPDALAESLRALAPRKISEIAPPEGAEFALVMVRRLESGEIVALGEVADDAALFERAARHLIG
ncbi:hypothetical protein Saro_0232 [Novosphingobium aromaticivorans DSM 12444]|uniref:Uncharacterized protein n=1 Tax=Novosphingobium aromaticivorans (strain ATCC 700278 / DSM 12444 / CCUG 56034 / CIP 105152 / NBRC 16084 / F199) TaxID=279238 RepID=Q2GBU3_NOVAD|nr:hypothetical protein [Novosphingobium aromaticivorans]ABD24680.1 hypothetical protein Saro_0232 [Novosphingobium aromaticivorans DSM 12444]SCY20881.1 hypothetical protein SAMN05660666_01038 [Novosphingobium aromaticivorans]